MKFIGREVLDSRGNPTVEVELWEQDMTFRAIVPSGASTGIHEALELRDKGKRYLGKGVTKAVKNIAKLTKSIEANMSLEEVDRHMLRLDGTKNKKKYGANAILGVSMAYARYSAFTNQMPLYEYISDISKRKMKMPVPFCNIINGGQHAGNKLQMQEFMIAPVGAKSFKEGTRIVAETYHILKEIIKKKYGKDAVNVGDEGGFAPNINDAYAALDLIMKAINESGYKKELKIAMDPAASEFFVKGKYDIGKIVTKDKLIEHYLDLIKKYPIISLEDPFGEDDFDSWKKLSSKTKLQIVGDDLLVTNTERINMALDKKLCNALLLKVNQIGSMTEAIAAANLAFKNKWNVMVSHRSGETEDPFIADLAVGLGTGQIKLGAPCRSDRVAKYNQLMRIEEELGKIKYGLK